VGLEGPHLAAMCIPVYEHRKSSDISTHQLASNYTNNDLTPHRHPQSIGRRMYKNADWERIGQGVSQAIQEPPTIEQLQTTRGLERESDRFMRAILTTIDQHTQRAKPSPYAKRWWTPTLTTLRQTMTALRNRVTTLRRRFEDVEDAKANHQAAKQRYFQEIQKQ
jgi:hypothetical protein